MLKTMKYKEKMESLRLQDVNEETVWRGFSPRTRLGELLRAIVGIWYRYYNDGKMVGSEEPDKDVNSMARFIHAEYEDTGMDEILSAMWGMVSHNNYEIALDKLIGWTIQYIDRNPWLAGEKNYYDCLDYAEEEDEREKEFGYD